MSSTGNNFQKDCHTLPAFHTLCYTLADGLTNVPYMTCPPHVLMPRNDLCNNLKTFFGYVRTFI